MVTGHLADDVAPGENVMEQVDARRGIQQQQPMCVCVCVREDYVYTHLCIHTYIHAYMHTHTHIWTWEGDHRRGWFQGLPAYPNAAATPCSETPLSRDTSVTLRGQELRNLCLIHPLEWVAVQVAAKARPVTGD